MKKNKQIEDIFSDFNTKILNIQKQLFSIKENMDKRKYEEKLKEIKDE